METNCGVMQGAVRLSITSAIIILLSSKSIQRKQWGDGFADGTSFASVLSQPGGSLLTNVQRIQYDWSDERVCVEQQRPVLKIYCICVTSKLDSSILVGYHNLPLFLI